MLRHDDAIAATPEDASLIERMSGDASDPELDTGEVAIRLTMLAGEASRNLPRGQYKPNWKRWESFGWIVSGDVDVETEIGLEKAFEQEQATIKSARAKLDAAGLTDAERRALGIETSTAWLHGIAVSTATALAAASGTGASA
jgi:hypothetical protein